MTLPLTRTIAGLIAALAAASASAQITLYEGENFSGRSFRSDNSVSNLEPTGFNDRAASVVVRGGRWQLCADAFFRGSCVTVGPGEYRSLDAVRMQGAISSVRELGWTPDGAGGWDRGPDPRGPDRGPDPRGPDPRYADPRGPDPRGGYVDRGDAEREHWGRDGWGSGARAILFEGRDLTGRALAVNPAGTSNLHQVGFNDRAASLRVEAGYWIFCSDAQFQGECRTFGPGDYASLPRGLDGRISSGRRVSNEYPYRQSPTWDR